MENNISNTSTPVSNYQGGTKKSKTSTVLAIVFFLTTLGFGGAFAWAMLRDGGGSRANTAGSTGCAVTEEEVATAKEGSVGEIVANYDSEKEVRDLISGMVSYMGTKGDIVSPQYQSMTYDSGSVVVKLDDGGYVTTDKSYGFAVTPNNVELVYSYENAAEEYLVSQGFTKNTEFSTEFESVFDKDSVRCEFSKNSSPFALVCSNTSWYKKDKLELIKALKEAYVNGGNTFGDKNIVIADPSKIETSPSGKYERIQATIGNIDSLVGSAYMMFYREKGTAEWTFVTAGNGIPSCSDFEGAASEAFAGSGLGCSDGSDIKKVGE